MIGITAPEIRPFEMAMAGIRRYRPSTWLDWLLLLVICGLIPVYILYLRTPAVGFYHDDGIYVVNAKALATGQGYRTISLPTEPSQTKYPVLYPALLALLWKLFPAFPQNVFAFRLLSLAGSLLWFAALYRMILEDSKDNSKRLAIWITVLIAAGQWAVWISACTLPDSLFCASTTAALLFLTRALSKPDRAHNRDLLGGALFSAAAFLLRSAGLPLLVAPVLVFLVHRRFHAAFKFFVLTAAVVAPWFIWQMAHPAPLNPVEAYYTKASYVRGHILAGYSSDQVKIMLVVNLLRLFFGLLPSGVSGYDPAALVLAVLAGLVALAGLSKNLRQSLSVLNVWICLYVAMLLFWLSGPGRYEIPLLPFTCLFAWYAVKNQFRNGSRGLHIAGGAFLILLLLLSGQFLINAAVNTLATQTPSWAEGEPDEWPKVILLTDWLKQNTSREAVITGHTDPTLYLYSQRHAVRPYASKFCPLFYGLPPGVSPVGTAEDLRANLLEHRVSYIVVTPAKWFRESYFFVSALMQVMRQHPKAFSVAYRLPDARYFILAVHRDAL